LKGTTARLAMSVVAVTGAAVIVGGGTYATFTSTVSNSQTITSGTVTIALGAPGAATDRLTVNASNIVPGDTIQRAFDLTNSGTVNLASIALTTTATTSSVLNTDTVNGLQMVVDKCSTAWTESGVSPAFTYTCGGTDTTILTSQPVIETSDAMAGLNALTTGGTDHMRVTLTFPTGTNSPTFEGLTSVIQYSFTGTQRAGTNE
jgi:predicted ribosomally synthesized peptide with SipW-like signal peptide